MDSDKAAESERILFGWFWELRDISKSSSVFRGITLHRTYLEHNLVVIKMRPPQNWDYSHIIPESYYHSYSPFQVSAKHNFYEFIKDFETKVRKNGIFVSSYPLSNIFNLLEDFNEFKAKYENLNLMGSLILDEENLYGRIAEDTNNWNKQFLR